MKFQFLTDDKMRKAINAAMAAYKANKWDQAYENVNGKQAFLDGLYCGYNNGYIQACEDMLAFMRFFARKYPDVTLKDTITRIK